MTEVGRADFAANRRTLLAVRSTFRRRESTPAAAIRQIVPINNQNTKEHGLQEESPAGRAIASRLIGSLVRQYGCFRKYLLDTSYNLAMDWTQIILAVITLVGTLGGVWLGHRWAEDAARQREALAAAQQADTVRTIVRLEIEANLETLRVFRETVLATARTRVRTSPTGTPSGTIPQPSAFDLVSALATQPPLLFDRLALETQLGALPVALTDAGVLAVLSLYKTMKRLETIQHLVRPMLEEVAAFRAAYFEARHSGLAGPPSQPAPPLHQVGPALWEEFERLTVQLLTKGNPLLDQEAKSTSYAIEHQTFSG